MLRRLARLAMPNARAPGFFKFNDVDLQALGNELRSTYRNAVPFPHVVIDNFLPERIADHLLAVYPRPDDPVWFDWKQGDVTNQPKKLGVRHASRMETADPFVHNVCYAFNAYPFIHFLEQLTGIENLLPDPCLRGGGMHQILPGGRLNIHADINYVNEVGLYRKINALLYLNKNWKDAYGGDLELWNRDMTACAARIQPVFNRCVIFNTCRWAYHLHPEPLTCPEHMTRKSMAFFYYSSQPDADDGEPRSILWQSRPTDGSPKE
jgi:hypothetical protein